MCGTVTSSRPLHVTDRTVCWAFEVHVRGHLTGRMLCACLCARVLEEGDKEKYAWTDNKAAHSDACTAVGSIADGGCLAQNMQIFCCGRRSVSPCKI